MQPGLDLKRVETCRTNLPYRELVGSLLFLARTTRPDISYAVSKLAQYCNGHDLEHWKAAKEVLRYLKGTMTTGIRYEKQDSIELYSYTDFDYAGDRQDRKSTTGFAFFINNQIISWCSQKQDIVSLSSTEAEYIALAAGAKECMWLRKFLGELGVEQETPTKIFVDNTSAIRLAENPEFHKRSKHIDVRFHFTRFRF